jgi:DNA repair photolyase
MHAAAVWYIRTDLLLYLREDDMHNVKGRGAQTNPPNRFEELHIEPLEYEETADGEESRIPTVFYDDNSRSILAENESPDIPFSYSLNPYRGCEHGCVYCYARPSHEYLGFSSGLDFETRIMVKRSAPSLLRKTLGSKSWTPQVVALSGNTDCYQPVERKLKITRACLEVISEYGNPVSIITKNFLVTRDIDILAPMAERRLTAVLLSITTLDPELANTMEPRTSLPDRRLKAISILAGNGIPVGVMVAPVVPGLTDSEIPDILSAAKTAGASFAGYMLLRLPYQVKDLFVEWIGRKYPQRAAKVINRIRDTRDGELSCSVFGKRMRGTGQIAQNIEQLFYTSCRKMGFAQSRIQLDTTQFRRSGAAQTDLFGNVSRG